MSDTTTFSVTDLRDAVAELTGRQPQDVPDDVSFLQLGVDSVGMLRLLNRVRRIAGMPVEQLTADPTVASWQRLLRLPGGDRG